MLVRGVRLYRTVFPLQGDKRMHAVSVGLIITIFVWLFVWTAVSAHAFFMFFSSGAAAEADLPLRRCDIEVCQRLGQICQP